MDEEELEALQVQQHRACTGGDSCGTDACSHHRINVAAAEPKPAISRPTDDPSSWSWARSAARAGRSTGSEAAGSASTSSLTGMTCIKCGQRPAAAIARLNDPMCGECLQSAIMQKLRTSCRTASLLQAGDRVLVALSGGAASLALLHCLQLLQNRNPDRQERGLVSFALQAVHVLPPPQLPTSKPGRAATPMQAASSTAAAAPSAPSIAAAEDDQVDQLRAALAAMNFQGQLHVLPLHAIFNEQDHRSVQGVGTASHPLQHESHKPPPAADQQHQQQQQQHPSGTQQVADPQALPCLDSSSRDGDANGIAASQEPGSASALLSQTAKAVGMLLPNSTDAAAERLTALLLSVNDATGRQDLATALRMRLLRATATRLHCNKLVTGDCATTLAVHIIADAAKGRGFSLPADIQAWDGRAAAAGGPVVLHPLRDATSRELEALCRVQGIVPVISSSGSSSGSSSSRGSSRGSRGSINTLAEDFVASMQASLPASVFTVLRTASSLQAFPFNSPPMQHSTSRGVAAGDAAGSECQAVAGVEEVNELSFCRVCDAPLEPSAAERAQEPAGSSSIDGDHDRDMDVCYSCQHQIMAKVGVAGAGGGSAVQRRGQQAQVLRMLQQSGALNCGIRLS